MACDICHRRKVRCNAAPGTICPNCQRNGHACSYLIVEAHKKKRRQPRPRAPRPPSIPSLVSPANAPYDDWIQLEPTLSSERNTAVPTGPTSPASPTSPPQPPSEPPRSVVLAVSAHRPQPPPSTTTSSPPPAPPLPPTPPSCDPSDEDALARGALDAFYASKMLSGEVQWRTRLAYVGTGVSNLAHLVSTRTDSPACLHYPFPHYRPMLPWKPGPDSMPTHAGPQWRFTMQADPDLAEVPMGVLREQLLDAYFSLVHPGFPIVHEGEFREQLARSGKKAQGEAALDAHTPGTPQTADSEPPPLLLMQCVFLVGAHVCRTPLLEASRPSIKATLYRRAVALFNVRHENDRVLLVQAALLLAWHTSNADDISGNSWHWIGVAVRIALGLGMHRNVAHAKLPARGQSLFRVLWWAIVQAETLCALQFGRPLGIGLDDCDQPLATEADFVEYGLPESDLAGGPAVPPRRPSRANVPFFRENTALCLLLHDVLRLHAPGVLRRFGGPESPRMLEARAGLNRSLAHWCLRLPPALAIGSVGRPAAAAAASSFWAAQLHLHYYTALLCLNRQRWTRPTERTTDEAAASGYTAGYGTGNVSVGYGFYASEASSNTATTTSATVPPAPTARSELCDSAAARILDCFDLIRANGWAAQCWCSALTALLAAAIQFSTNVWRVIWASSSVTGPAGPGAAPAASLPLALDMLDRLNRLRPAAAALAPYWPTAEGLERLLGRIYGELQTALREGTGTTGSGPAPYQTTSPLSAFATTELDDLWRFGEPPPDGGSSFFS